MFALIIYLLIYYNLYTKLNLKTYLILYYVKYYLDLVHITNNTKKKTLKIISLHKLRTKINVN